MRPTDLRGILRYVPQFREKTFVVAVDGAVVDDDNFGNLLMDVAVLWSLNIRTVLVHGAAAQIQALADEKVAEPSDLEGSGVTDAETLQLALARRQPPDPRDPRGAERGRPARGQHQRRDRPSARASCAASITSSRAASSASTSSCCRPCSRTASCPWCRPWAWTATAAPNGVNSDAVAVEVAKALRAVKLVYITTADGLVVNGTLARQISVDELDGRPAEGSGGPGPGLEGAPRGGRLPGGRAARARDQRHGRRGAAGRGLLERGHRHPRLRERVPADPPRAQARRAQHPAAHPGLGGERGAAAAHRRPRSRSSSTTTTSSRSTGTRWPAWPCTSTRRRRRASWPACACAPRTRTRASAGAWSSTSRSGRARRASTRSSRSPPRPSTSSARRPASREGTPDDLPPARRERYEQSGRRSRVLVKALRPDPASGSGRSRPSRLLRGEPRAAPRDRRRARPAGSSARRGRAGGGPRRA